MLYISVHSYCMMVTRCCQIHEHTSSDQLFLPWCYYSSTTRTLGNFFAQEVFLLGRTLFQSHPWKPPSLAKIEGVHLWFDLLGQFQTLVHCWLKSLSDLHYNEKPLWSYLVFLDEGCTIVRDVPKFSIFRCLLGHASITLFYCIFFDKDFIMLKKGWLPASFLSKCLSLFITRPLLSGKHKSEFLIGKGTW